MSTNWDRKCSSSKARAHREAGQPFNLGSPKQIAEIFFEKKGMPVIKKTPSGAPSTDEDVLERLAPRSPAWRKSCSITGKISSSSPPTRTSAEDGESAHGQGAYQLRSGGPR